MMRQILAGATRWAGALALLLAATPAAPEPASVGLLAARIDAHLCLILSDIATEVAEPALSRDLAALQSAAAHPELAEAWARIAPSIRALAAGDRTATVTLGYLKDRPRFVAISGGEAARSVASLAAGFLAQACYMRANVATASARTQTLRRLLLSPATRPGPSFATRAGRQEMARHVPRLAVIEPVQTGLSLVTTTTAPSRDDLASLARFLAAQPGDFRLEPEGGRD